MEQMIATLEGTRDRSLKHAERILKRFAISGDEPPVTAIYVGFNSATMCVELLSQYLAHWTKFPAVSLVPITQQQLRVERGDRLSEITKWMFVGFLSALEHAWKQADKKFPNVLGLNHTKRVYFASIVGKAHAAGLLDATDYGRWVGLTEIRNSVVHNDGIAEEDLKFSLPNVEFEMVTGIESRGPVRRFVEAIDWCADAHADWCSKFLLKAGRER